MKIYSVFWTGIETGYLLGATNKKVVLLYRRELEKKVSLLITGNTHPNCTLAPYAGAEEAEGFIRANIPGGGRSNKKAPATVTSPAPPAN